MVVETKHNGSDDLDYIEECLYYLKTVLIHKTSNMNYYHYNQSIYKQKPDTVTFQYTATLFALFDMYKE